MKQECLDEWADTFGRYGIDPPETPEDWRYIAHLVELPNLGRDLTVDQICRFARAWYERQEVLAKIKLAAERRAMEE